MIKKLKRRYYNLRVRDKFFSILNLQAIVLIIIGIIGLRIFTFTYNNLLYNQASEILNLYSRNVESSVKSISDLSYSIITDNQVQQNLTTIKVSNSPYDRFSAHAKLNEKLTNWLFSEKSILSISIIDSYGEYILSTGMQTEGLNRDRIVNIIHEAERNKGAMVWCEPLQSDNALILAREINQISNLSLEQLGTLIIRIDPQKLVSRYHGYMKQKSSLALISSEGIIFQEDDYIDDKNLEIFLNNEHDYTIEKVSGEKLFISNMFSSYTDWTFVNILPYGTIFKNILFVKMIMVFVYIFVLIAEIYAAKGLARQMMEPIEALSEKMKIVEAGDFENAVFDEGSYGDRNDEIVKLDRDFNAMTRKIKELIEENYVKQIMIKDYQYKTLQAQINPHFLYNTLDSINWMAKMNNQPEIAIMVKSLGNLLRSSIGKGPHLITLGEEVDILNDYINIQKIRYEDRLDFNIEIEPSLREYMVPKLTLQPIVENAINHGLEVMTGICQVRVAARKNDDSLLIEVMDNGPGIEESVIEQIKTGTLETSSSGIGLRNIDDRIKIIFGEGYGIDVRQNSSGGTIVIVNLPCERGYESV